jgi:hypothetical protein
MKGQFITFIPKALKNNRISKGKTKTSDHLSGQTVNFSASAAKKKNQQTQLIGKNIGLTIRQIGSWSLSKEKPSNCMICKLPFKEGQSVSRCPMCKSLFHANHLFEWLKVKGQCPVCRQSLRPDGVEKVNL